MSDREKAIEYMNRQKFAEALNLFEIIIAKDPDAGVFYMAGQCCRMLGDLPRAVLYLRKAVELNKEEPPFFLALGIALQLTNQYQEAIDAFINAIKLDRDYDLAYNSLALTNKKIGNLEAALKYYDEAATALGNRIVKSMVNSRSTRVFDLIRTPHDLWTHYAADCALRFAASNRVDNLSFPTDEFADHERKTEAHGGLFWTDFQDENGEKNRLYLPNFFNFFQSALGSDQTYANIIGNKGTVLDMVGKKDEAEMHFEEASFFLNLAAN